MARSANLTRWVQHFLECARCGRDHVDLDVDLRYAFARRTPARTSELCKEGRALQEAWLDEPEPPRRPAA